MTRTLKLALLGGSLAAVAGAFFYRRSKRSSSSSGGPATGDNFATGPAVVAGQEADARRTVNVQTSTTARKRTTTANRRDHRA